MRKFNFDKDAFVVYVEISSFYNIPSLKSIAYNWKKKSIYHSLINLEIHLIQKAFQYNWYNKSPFLTINSWHYRNRMSAVKLITIEGMDFHYQNFQQKCFKKECLFLTCTFLGEICIQEFLKIGMILYKNSFICHTPLFHFLIFVFFREGEAAFWGCSDGWSPTAYLWWSYGWLLDLL